MVTTDSKVSVAYNNAYLFLTHFPYWLQASFGAVPGTPHSGTQPQGAASIPVTCQRNKE